MSQRMSSTTARSRDYHRREGRDRDCIFGMLIDPYTVSRRQRALPGLKRRAEVVVYWYTHGPSDYTGQMYLSTQTPPLPYGGD